METQSLREVLYNIYVYIINNLKLSEMPLKSFGSRIANLYFWKYNWRVQEYVQFKF